MADRATRASARGAAALKDATNLGPAFKQAAGKENREELPRPRRSFQDRPEERQVLRI